MRERQRGFVVHRSRLFLKPHQQPLQVVEEQVGRIPVKTVPDHYPERSEVFSVFGECVRGYLPAALAQPTGDVEDRVSVYFVPKLEGEDGKLAAVGYELERTELRDALSGVGSDVPALLLDAPVALETQPEKVVILCDDLGARTREVQRQRRHVSPEVVHPEDKLLRQGR